MDNNDYYNTPNSNYRKCSGTAECCRCPKPCDEDCKNQEQCINQCQGGQSQETGDLEQIQGSQIQEQGDQTESQGDLIEVQGDQTQTQGEQSATQGDQTQTQGEQLEIQGDQLQTQGEQFEVQGDQTQTQGNLTETLGDMTQLQGGETQGDQSQGEQIQTMTGHEGQTQGDQILFNNPTISTPVSVSGVNIRVNCCKDCNENHHCGDCKKDIIALLTLLKSLALPITVPANAAANFYYLGAITLPTLGTVGDISECTVQIVPLDGENAITILTSNIEAITISETATTPNLFTALLNYLALLPNTISPIHDFCDKCFELLELQLYSYFLSQQEISVFLNITLFTGFIYKIHKGILYLVDDLETPTIIIAIPICKIIGYQSA